MSIRLQRTPWSRFIGDPGIPLAAHTEGAVDLGVFPRLVGGLPADFLWNGREPALVSCGGDEEGNQWSVPLPNQGLSHQWSIATSKGTMELAGLPVREADQEEREKDPRESWLRWQYQRYKELALYDPASSADRVLEAPLPFGARRAWKTVREQWMSSGEDEAELSLIVELAQSSKLHNALRSIGSMPRRMLRRVHRQQKLSRIQEMDAHTLRIFARRPGRSYAEKAGPRQELVAVAKEDTSDLPENAVLLWSVRRMEQMARTYCLRNDQWKTRPRYVAVLDLRSILRRILEHPNLMAVGALHHHLSTPTYCFQFEPRYRQVWDAYIRIRRQDMAIDDVWRWQGHTWGTSTRQLLMSLLIDSGGWRETRQSNVYCLSEGRCGDWTTGPSVPGPLDTLEGECHILDLKLPYCRGQRMALGLPREVLDSGADWVLCWPTAKVLVLVWAALSGDEGASGGDGLDDLDRLDDRLAALSGATGWRYTGWILQARPHAGANQPCNVIAGSHFTVFALPSTLHGHWGDIRTGFVNAVERLYGR